MSLDLFSVETPFGSILVNDHLPLATTQSLHFGWSLTGGSTVSSMWSTRFSYLKEAIPESSDGGRLLNPKVMIIVTFGTLRPLRRHIEQQICKL